jgi:hypothetical protein
MVELKASDYDWSKSSVIISIEDIEIIGPPPKPTEDYFWYLWRIRFKNKDLGEIDLEIASLEDFEVILLEKQIRKFLDGEIENVDFWSSEELLNIKIEKPLGIDSGIFFSIWRDLHEVGQGYPPHGDSYLGMRLNTSRESLNEFIKDLREEGEKVRMRYNIPPFRERKRMKWLFE